MARGFLLNAIIGDTSTAISAAGTTQSGATPIPAGLVSVGTVTTSANGVLLRAQAATTVSVVVNEDTAEDLLVYPWSGASINGATADLPMTLPSGRGALFIELSATKIAAIF
jgi:hypothetical protein